LVSALTLKNIPFDRPNPTNYFTRVYLCADAAWADPDGTRVEVMEFTLRIPAAIPTPQITRNHDGLRRTKN
jgi:hypothetical protein